MEGRLRHSRLCTVLGEYLLQLQVGWRGHLCLNSRSLLVGALWHLRSAGSQAPSTCATDFCNLGCFHEWLCSVKPGFVHCFFFAITHLKVQVSYFISLLIVPFGKMLEHILQMWLCFFNFAWSLCYVSCCCLLSFMRFPMFLPENYFIYASQVTLRPQNHLMMDRWSLGTYLIDILWNVMPVLQKLNSFCLYIIAVFSVQHGFT